MLFIFDANACRLAGQQILQSTYGIKVESQEDRFIRNVQTAIGAVSDAARPGLFIVDAIPFRTQHLFFFINKR